MLNRFQFLAPPPQTSRVLTCKKSDKQIKFRKKRSRHCAFADIHVNAQKKKSVIEFFFKLQGYEILPEYSVFF